MDNTDTLANLLYGLLCLAPFCLGLAGIIAVAALLFAFIRRQWQPKNVQTLADERAAMQSQVAQQAKGLRAWSSGCLTDLSTDWDATWSKFGRDLNVSGKIPSARDPNDAASVAFALRVRGARQPDGQLVAATSNRDLYFRISAEGVSIHVDNALWGKVQSDGTLLDASGQNIGSAIRPGGMPVLFRVGTFATLRDAREQEYPVVLSGRTIARLTNARVQMINVIQLKKQQFPPAVALNEAVSEQEAVWLLALAILQVAFYNVFETLWTN